MTTLIPTLSSCAGRMTTGEKRFAERLETKLENDYWCWYDVPIGEYALHPDFIIYHPARGLLVLEVKDWKVDTLKQIDKEQATLLVDGELVTAKNPLLQARVYMFAIINLLKKDTTLIAHDGPHKGQPLFPYAHGVVLTNITRKQFQQGELGHVLKENLVICKDEMTENIDAETFQKSLWGMFSYNLRVPITLPQIDRIRWHIFPDLRIMQQANLFGEDQNAKETLVPDIVKIMDIQQEQLARSLGEGHRIIHGVAGSGKTMILGYRAQHLALQAKRPILILCFNRELAVSLVQSMHNKGLTDKVHVKTFHSWCNSQLKTYGIPMPRFGNTSEEKEQFFRECVDLTIRSVDRKLIPAGQYDAVLVDEGHDFVPEWFKLIVQMVNPESNTLLVLYDDAQSIYGKQKKKIVFSQVGIQARGRTTILKLNYRNTIEILAVAKAFAKDLLHGENSNEDQAPLLEPIGAGASGPLPQIIKLPKLRNECDRIAKTLIEHHDAGMAWSDMAIIYRRKTIADEIIKRCIKYQIPLKKSGGGNSVHLLTMHSSKGLEYPLVCIPAVGMPFKYEETLEEEARLLYVAMTRAQKYLYMTHGENSYFANKLNTALGSVNAAYAN